MKNDDAMIEALKVCYETKNIKDSTVVAYGDIYKAFDSVEQQKLIEMIALEKLPIEYRDLANDYNNLNLKIGNTTLKRTQGIPQGGRFSPPFFNLYMKNTLKNVDIKLDYIYADNIMLIESNADKLVDKILNTTVNLNENNLRLMEQFKTFAYNKTNITCTQEQYAKISKIEKPQKSINKQDDLETDRLLGFQIRVDQAQLSIDEDKVINELNFKTPIGPAYEMINFYKQKILPKIRFNLDHTNYDLDKIHKYYLKKMLVTYIIPKQYYNMNFKMDKYSYWAKFLSLYIGRSKTMLKITGQNTDYLMRWHILCKYAEVLYIPSFQAIRFVYEGCANFVLMDLEQKHIKHNLKLCDDIYFMIVRKINKITAYEMITTKLIKKIGKFKRNKTYDKDPIGNIFK